MSEKDGSGKTLFVKALYEFKGEKEGDMPMMPGDYIRVIARNESLHSWWRGRNLESDVEGDFPANFVEILSDKQASMIKKKKRDSTIRKIEDLGSVTTGASEDSDAAARYRYIRCLAKGNFASVYIAKYKRRIIDGTDVKETMYQEVCIKKIAVNTLGELNMALQEAMVLAKASQSGGVCRYVDSFIESKHCVAESNLSDLAPPTFFCIVTKYYPEGTLQDMINQRQVKKRGGFSELEVASLIYDIATALKGIHELDIIHRDLKPKNIFLTRSRGIRIGDFGVAKMLLSQNLTGTFVGTNGYIAPEIRNMQPYGLKCDMWSLGVIMLQLLTLSSSSTAAELQKLSKRVSAYTMKLLLNLLSPKPSQRPSCHRVEKFILAHYPIRLDERLNRVMRTIGTDSNGCITVNMLCSFLSRIKEKAGLQHIPLHCHLPASSSLKESNCESEREP
uniref:Protein kinase domain-containing protein n=1 Tax=Lotharella globosa TaxID=91324 RepID=A0A7S4DIS5_9EUKA